MISHLLTRTFTQNTEDYLFQVILEKTIRIPRSLSVKAASVLKGFLNKNPADRLGCSRDSAFMDIVSHPFFKSIDWEMVSFNLHCNIFSSLFEFFFCFIIFYFYKNRLVKENKFNLIIFISLLFLSLKHLQKKTPFPLNPL